MLFACIEFVKPKDLPKKAFPIHASCVKWKLTHTR